MDTASQITKDERPKRVDVLDALERLNLSSRPDGQGYTVMAEVICKQRPDQPEIPLAYVTNLGNFPTEEDAKKRTMDLIEITGYQGIFYGKTRQWHDISTSNRPNRTEYFPGSDDHEAIVREQHRIKQESLQRQQEERERIEQEIAEERDRIHKDSMSIESYSYNWFALIKNKSVIEISKRELASAEEAFDKRKALIRKQLEQHPEYDEILLPRLKERLGNRGEDRVYASIETGYNELRSTILN